MLELRRGRVAIPDARRVGQVIAEYTVHRRGNADNGRHRAVPCYLLNAAFTALLPVGMWALLPDHLIFYWRSGSLYEIWEILYYIPLILRHTHSHFFFIYYLFIIFIFVCWVFVSV